MMFDQAIMQQAPETDTCAYCLGRANGFDLPTPAAYEDGQWIMEVVSACTSCKRLGASFTFKSFEQKKRYINKQRPERTHSPVTETKEPEHYVIHVTDQRDWCDTCTASCLKSNCWCKCHGTVSSLGFERNMKYPHQRRIVEFWLRELELDIAR